jgi:hypothetical protein
MRCTRLSVSGLFLLTGLLGGCGGDDSDEANGGLSPMVDGSSGWKRIKSFAPQGPIGIGTSMSMTAMTRVDGTFAVVEQEVRGSQGGDLSDRYLLRFRTDVTAAHLDIGEAYDPNNQSAPSGDYRYVFAPGTLDVYQSFREDRGSETWSGLRTNGPVVVGELRSSGGGHFAGLADVYADGSALIPGTDLFGALLRNGEWTRIYGRWSNISEPQTFAGCPVQLADHTFVWALLREGDIAIGLLADNPQIAGQQQVKSVVSIPPPPNYIASTCFARAFGNQIVFISATKLTDTTTLSAHRWTPGATTLETLYSDVELPPTMPLPPVTNNAQHLLLLDVDGRLTYFAEQPQRTVVDTVLVQVDAAGPRVASTIPGGAYLVQGPWLVDGAIYAGIGATSGREVTQLDLVELEP